MGSSNSPAEARRGHAVADRAGDDGGGRPEAGWKRASPPPRRSHGGKEPRGRHGWQSASVQLQGVGSGGAAQPPDGVSEMAGWVLAPGSSERVAA